MENNDHDLLIRIETKLEQVIKDVADIKTNLAGRVEELELNSVSKKDFETLQRQVEILKLWRSGIVTSIALIGFIITSLILWFKR